MKKTLLGMLAALLAAALWLMIASARGWPVSTTHSIVGALVGFGIAGIGMTSARTRDRLVERLRAHGIRSEAVLNQIRNVPRHLFVDEALASRAYEDTALPIGHGQTISQPYVVARMTEALIDGFEGENVLEIRGSIFVGRRPHGDELVQTVTDPGGEVGAEGQGHPGPAQALQRLLQTVVAPIEHVVVGECTAIHAGRRQAADIGGVHAGVDALGPVPVADRDGRFQVNDARIGHDPFQLRQCIAPRVVECHGPLDRAIPVLGQPDVVARVPNIGFVQPWIARMRQDLVDAATRTVSRA